MIEGGPALGTEPLADHHLDEAPEAADAEQELLGIALVDDEGVHALAGDAGGEDAPARGACHVCVFALRVDDIGRDPPVSGL